MRTGKERFSGDCKQDSQERIETKARTKRGTKIINVRLSLSAAEMNPETDFSINDNLIDICFLTVTASAYVRFPHEKWSREVWQPFDVRVIVVSIVADNTLLRRLPVLHPHLKNFWTFCPIERRMWCLANSRQQSKTITSLDAFKRRCDNIVRVKSLLNKQELFLGKKVVLAYFIIPVRIPPRAWFFFSGLCSSSVKAALALMTVSTYNCYCWTYIYLFILYCTCVKYYVHITG